ncbi:hypothetical protein [Cedecea sp. MMO-103]|uniref:hypothetical protein n=1 Tax=Cedecea sp. MMO-103 TaxID=3081238 RepID=UPI00301B2993
MGVTGAASAGIQYGTTGEVKLSDVIASVIFGGITVGKGYNPTVTWNAASGYYQAEISGDDPLPSIVGNMGDSAASKLLPKYLEKNLRQINDEKPRRVS